MPVSDYTPNVEDVGQIDMSRTVNDVGSETGTFTDPDQDGRGGTRPTQQQVLQLIERACNDVAPFLGTDIPVDLQDDAKQLVALRAAMWLELTFFGTEVAQARSPYAQYKEMYDAQLIALKTAIQSQESGGDPANTLTGTNVPAYGFPPAGTWMSREL